MAPVFGLPREPAATIALRTTRAWCGEHPDAFDVVVFYAGKPGMPLSCDSRSVPVASRRTALLAADSHPCLARRPKIEAAVEDRTVARDSTERDDLRPTAGSDASRVAAGLFAKTAV